MKFVIVSNNLKLFGKTISCLSKIGDEIYVEPLENSLSLRTVNSSRSAFVCYSFNKKFFSHFDSQLKHKFDQDTSVLNDKQDDDVEVVESFKCKIPSKCLLYIFKNMSSVEKNVEKCTITIKYVPIEKEDEARIYDYDATMMKKVINEKNEEQYYETKFIIIMNCKFGVRKTYIMSISDCENLQAVFTTDNCPNKMDISAKYFNETINSFSNDIEEITFSVQENKMTVKNYVESDNQKSVVNTQVVFEKDEFEAYDIESENDITFCLKEFKVCLLFGHLFDLNLNIYYERKGRPIIFAYNLPEFFEISYILATLTEELSTIHSTNANCSVSQSQQSIIINNETLLEPTRKLNSSIIPSNLSTNSNKPKKQNTVRFDTTPQPSPKQIKRTLYDASNNQQTLNDSIEEDSNDSTITKKPSSQDKNKDVVSAKGSNKSTDVEMSGSLPPAKKMKSLIQSMFDDDDDDDTNDENKTEKEQSQTDRKINSSVYVEETDSDSD